MHAAEWFLILTATLFLGAACYAWGRLEQIEEQAKARERLEWRRRLAPLTEQNIVDRAAAKGSRN